MYACEIKYVGSNPLIKANGFGERPEPKKKKEYCISISYQIYANIRKKA